MTSSEKEEFSAIGDAELRRDVAALAATSATAAGVLSRVVMYFSKDKVKGDERRKDEEAMPSTQQLGSHVGTVGALGFSMPVRKTLSLGLYSTFLVLAAPASGPVVAVPLASISRVLAVPTPNKPRPNVSLVFVLSSTERTFGLADSTALVCAFDAATSSSTLAITSDTHSDLARVLQKNDDKKRPVLNVLSRAGLALEEPNMGLFDASPNGKLGKNNQCWIDGLVKMKDGHLYLLPTTVFFGFKKPLLILQHSQLRSISFSFITSRTFTLVLHFFPTASSPSSFESFDIEMIDKNDLEAVLSYFKGRGIPVASADEEVVSSSSCSTANSSSSASGRVVMMGSGELLLDDEALGGVDYDDDELSRDSNGNLKKKTKLVSTALLDDDDDEENDDDFVGDGSDADDDLDEEYDSDHQTNDGSSDSDDASDDDDNEEDAEDDDDDEPPAVLVIDDDDDMDADVVVTSSTPSAGATSSTTSTAVVNPRKRKSEQDLVAAESGKSKRQFLAREDDDDDEEDDDDEDVDELAL
ncbi:UNVERIFIED_CONTAM: hypothetical protein HDU68_007345 [Siphonaria sp. JEL0065]|nr:hypothetical protein HDU68_007345 [Siphonaria sp. JEL0065]